MSRGEARHTHTRNPLRVRLKPDPVWAFLEERDISQNELARLTGISAGYLSQPMSSPGWCRLRPPGPGMSAVRGAEA